MLLQSFKASNKAPSPETMAVDSPSPKSSLQLRAPTANTVTDFTSPTAAASASNRASLDSAAATTATTTTTATAAAAAAAVSSNPQRPVNLRAASEPSPSKFLQVSRPEALLQLRPPRNRSPLSRSHLRSFSASSPASTPAMQRARSLPGVGDAGPTGLRHSSPSRSPVRTPSPLRHPAAATTAASTIASATVPRTTVGARRSFDEQQIGLSAGFTEIQIIEEDSELEVIPRPQLSMTESDSPWNSAVPPQQHGYTPSRTGSNRRRPASPLYHTVVAPPPIITQSPSSTPPPAYATLHSYQTPPTSVPAVQVGTVNTGRFNESFPQSATSSVPSTPTSLRSRSPSISSLETIPDSPDAEEAALEAFEIEKLKNAADEADGDGRGQSWGLGLVSAGVGASKQDKRKRWSVCGAERRGDFEMETIWED